PVEGAFDYDDLTRPIPKEEALAVLRRAEEAGLVHTTGNFRGRHYYICNCCPCCCAVLRGLTEFGVPAAVAHSGFRAAVDGEACLGCGACADRCPMGALSVPEGVAVVDPNRCIGCGVCALACPADALHLERRPDAAPPPQNIQEWMLLRAQARGIPLEEIL
ncbi:MAG: 4Fe-4S dicluster domain-containing protein, partial [Thermoflexia bacterium]